MNCLLPDIGTPVAGYARVLRKRRFGSLSFWTVRFRQYSCQLILSAQDTRDYGTVLRTTVGSSIWIEGVTCLSNSGEHSIKCFSVKLLAACAEMLPDKRAGLAQGKRYSDRLADLLSNDNAFQLFRHIALGTQEIRRLLWSLGFQEFSTGVLQERWEAGTAQAFQTHCNANGKDYRLGLTSELKLKKLQVAGFESVFEILQSFRNEGVDSMHSPEFTLLEISKVNATYLEMMQLTEDLVRAVALRTLGSCRIEYQQGEIDLSAQFERVSFYDACVSVLGVERKDCTLDTFAVSRPELFHSGMGRFTWVFKVVNKLLSPHFTRPTFITHIPANISPLVRADGTDNEVTERAALVIRGIDIADIYTDENDPQRVKAAMERQFLETGVPVNKEYLRTLSYGMPPSASIGMGLNRLFMLMRGTLPENIKETILFPIQ